MKKYQRIEEDARRLQARGTSIDMISTLLDVDKSTVRCALGLCRVVADLHFHHILKDGAPKTAMERPRPPFVVACRRQGFPIRKSTVCSVLIAILVIIIIRIWVAHARETLGIPTIRVIVWPRLKIFLTDRPV